MKQNANSFSFPWAENQDLWLVMVQTLSFSWSVCLFPLYNCNYDDKEPCRGHIVYSLYIIVNMLTKKRHIFTLDKVMMSEVSI